MSFNIAIASGKGGTGKTTVSVNLFHYLEKSTGNSIQLVDCDVEEPNDIIFFPTAKKTVEKEVTQLIPVIDKDKCTYCRKCAEYCEFNAIVVIPPVNFAEVNAALCHSCGACTVACKAGAIIEKPEPIGNVSFYKTEHGMDIAEGRLKIGSAMQTMLIRELQKNVPKEKDITIFDSPPGTSCPVVETISNADLVILVAEPTLFGLHDLKLMVKLVKELKLPYALVINKAGLGSKDIYDYVNEENIVLLGKIPFNEEYASKYARGIINEDIPAEIIEAYNTISMRITDHFLIKV